MNNYFKWFHYSLYRMKKFFHSLSRHKVTSSTELEASETQHPSETIKVVNYELLGTDLETRPPISNYHPDIQNEVRKTYLKIVLHQPPHNLVYPWSVQGDDMMSLHVIWYKKLDKSD